ncbi:MAG: carbohydrate kinase family protein [Anaerolineaceae bacterium]
MKKIWSLGISMLDLVTQPITEWPEYGGAVNADSADLCMGGTALNTAVTIAKLGGAPVGLISCIGRDIGADIIKSGLKDLDIDTNHLFVTENAKTGCAICFVHPNGERSFVLCVSANNELDESKIDFDAFHEGDFLHIGGAMAMQRTQGKDLAGILKRAKAKGVTISIDTCWDVTNQWKATLDPSLPYCDILITNEEESMRYSETGSFEEAIQHFISRGPQIVIVKMGSKGAYVYSSEFTGMIPAFNVKAVDGTGSGDSFVGAFLVGRYHNWPIEQSAVFASAVGAKCVTSYGATAGIVSYAETVEFIKSQSRTAGWTW